MGWLPSHSSAVGPTGEDDIKLPRTSNQITTKINNTSHVHTHTHTPNLNYATKVIKLVFSILHMTLNALKIITEEEIIIEHVMKIRRRWEKQRDVYLNKSFHYVSLFEMSVLFVMTIPTARVYRAL